MSGEEGGGKASAYLTSTGVRTPPKDLQAFQTMKGPVTKFSKH